MRFALFIAFTVLTTLLVVVSGCSIERTYRKKSIEQTENNVQVQCNILANQILNAGFRFDDDNEVLEAEIEQFVTMLNGRLLVIDKDFRVVKDTYGQLDGLYYMSKNVLNAMNGEEKTPEVLENQYMEVIVPIKEEDDNTTSGIMLVNVSTRDIDDMAEYINSTLKIFFSISIIVAIVVAAILAVIFTKDFKTLDKSLKYIAAGHVDESIPIVGYAELRKVIERFNGILNKMQILENSRQEFVSNVSHELKTPITSIKILADSLVGQENVPVELYQEFMSDIVDEIDRENKIINDLLSLVKMDKTVSNLNIQSVNVNDMLESILKRLRPLAKKRNIEITFETFRPVNAEIDEVKLTLAFSNLIENAIKYNYDNGWIRVSLNADHKFFYVKVQDGGIGIPEESQQQVFERFYRVDKARSRETGGSGLGLAITRNAILMHKGAVKLYSKEGEGTLFTVRIPLTYMS